MTRKELQWEAPEFSKVLNAIAVALKKRDNVYLRKFGTFKLVKRKAKKGRNIKAGTSVDIPERTVVKFVPSDWLLK